MILFKIAHFLDNSEVRTRNQQLDMCTGNDLTVYINTIHYQKHMVCLTSLGKHLGRQSYRFALIFAANLDRLSTYIREYHACMSEAYVQYCLCIPANLKRI